MKNKKNLIKEFTELYLIEKKARDTYIDLLRDMRDEDDIKVVNAIKNDEEKHMRIAEDIITLMS